MLKELYKESMDKYNPDLKLIESTKNAMYSTLSVSDSIERSELIGMSGSSVVNRKKTFNYKRLASCCALFAVVLGTAALCTMVSMRNTNPQNEDPFASAGHSAFEGDSPNDGKDSSHYISAETTTVSETEASLSGSAVTTVVTTSSVNTSTSQSQTVVTTTAPAPQQTTTKAQTSTLTSQTQAVTTTTAVQPTEPAEPERKDFGYYDPQYDPQFRDDFDPNMGDEFLFEYDNIYYYFDCFKSDKVMLDFDGRSVSLRRALDEKLIEPYELLEFDGFICKGYYDDDRDKEPIDVHLYGEEQMQQSGGFMNFENGGSQDCQDMQPAPEQEQEEEPVPQQ
ncbi:MAG: hypothetical protein IJO29_07060 [Oscillospiraceae bacterium]|nr:hypothetical protein [Oscillospiraceae bacterium]